MATALTLPKWMDLHAHFRQGPEMAAYLEAHRQMGCNGILAMPNTRPPVARVSGAAEADSWSVESYHRDMMAAGGDVFDHIIIPLYLTAQTTPQMIEEGAKSGLLKACKYYPPHGTTNSDFGAPFARFMENGVFKAMEEAGILLCIHGEVANLNPEAYFDQHQNAEVLFYEREMPKLRESFPNLKIVCEHITTKAAADFTQQSGDNVAATITPQHLLYTVGHLVKGLNYHLYCLPLVKFDADRQALRDAATASNNTQFFAGTDSAPHTTKATECGCAAGCFTGGIAPQLYAEAFEAAGLSLDDTDHQARFRRFLCENGPNFYELPLSGETFTLTRTPSTVDVLKTSTGTTVVPLPIGMQNNRIEPATLQWSLTL